MQTGHLAQITLSINREISIYIYTHKYMVTGPPVIHLYCIYIVTKYYTPVFGDPQSQKGNLEFGTPVSRTPDPPCPKPELAPHKLHRSEKATSFTKSLPSNDARNSNSLPRVQGRLRNV